MTGTDEEDLLAQADAALAGDAVALERLLTALKDPLFRLALRLLGNFADAEDATQEILVKIMTALASFERRSSIRTWAYRIALNHLRDIAASRHVAAARSFEPLTEQLEQGIAATPHFTPSAKSTDPALQLEAREIQLHCTQGILMHLDVDQRVAYVLCEVFDLDTHTAAQVLGISDAAFRQRLSRARRRLEAFMAPHCGLISSQARCTCERQAKALRLARGGRPIPIKFARGEAPPSRAEIERAGAELSRLQRIAVAFRDAPTWKAPDTLLESVRATLRTSPLFD